MIGCKFFFDLLKERGAVFFSGVPDSLLKDFIACITDYAPEEKHIIAANEGNAVACAAGYYLATGKPAVVYMQNSGLGNSVNPLTSLVAQEVYSIPMLLIIGWRGEPGTEDEPQHVQQGRVTPGMLGILEIPHSILPDSMEEAERVLDSAIRHMAENRSPYALLVRKGTFESHAPQTKEDTHHSLTREDAIRLIVSCLEPTDVVVSTTGKTSRELFELREEQQQGHNRDFLTVGSMGHSSSIALGIALAQPERNVYCFDGDGAFIMHMGSLGTIAKARPSNFRHIVFNNFSYESVGGQPTAADVMGIPAIAKASGYQACYSATAGAEIRQRLRDMQNTAGPVLLEIQVNAGSRSDLGRPTKTPQENKEALMGFLKPT